MARAILQSRNLTGFTALTTTTQVLTLTPGNVPDGSTLTRLVGSFTLEYLPAAGSAVRAWISVGLAVIDDTAVVDVALPNSHPDVWLGWWSQPVLLGHGGSDGTALLASDMRVDFDLHGQRILTPSAGIHLRLFSRLVQSINAGTASVRIGLAEFYKLPE